MEKGQFIIRDERVTYYGQTPHYLLNGFLTHPQLAVYCALDSFRNRRTGQLNPAYETLAERAGVSRGRLSGYIKALEQKGVLEVERHHRKPSLYKFVDPAMFLPPHPVPVAASSGASVAASSGASVAASSGATNLYKHLNQDKLTEEDTAQGAHIVSKSRFPVPVKGQPKEDMRQLVQDWFDTFKAVRHFASTEVGGYVAGQLSRLKARRGEAVLRWEIGAYWDWIEKKGVHMGDLADFLRKENMMHDRYIETHKGERT